ncbi:hypothetical protein MMC07_003961 [Pseudocyphellaria aurata]|nr:hypothetical protein [Pseudocyphellaria aurata]
MPVAATTTPTTAASNLVRFKTRVHPGQDASKNGLYLSGYHIGAGESDAVFYGTEPATGDKGFINNGTLQFDLGTDFPWYLQMEFEAYTQWSSVRVTVGPPTEDFAIKDRKLVWNGYGFSGWLVCDWYHGVPQLFWKTSQFQNVTTPNCASVDLVTVKA